MVPLDIHWKQLLWNCYHHGRKVKKDDSEIKELMGNYVFLERPQDLPLPFNKRIDLTYDFAEGLKKGLYDLKNYPLKGEALHDYVISWNDDNQVFLDKYSRDLLKLDTEPFIYTYPERLLHNYNITKVDEDCYESSPEFIDQFKTMYLRLENNKGSNRAVATLYHPGLDMTINDIPCLNWLQATIRENKLELHCMFRSNDLYGAWPSNMYLLTFLGLWLSEQFLNEEILFNGIHYHSSSLHIYKTDLPMVKEILGDK